MPLLPTLWGQTLLSTLMHVTGEWVMRFMVLVLAATPLARWVGRGLHDIGGCLVCMRGFMQRCIYLYLRRSISVGVVRFFSRNSPERPYVLVGFLAWLILVPLGITSANSIRRKMGRIGERYTS